MAPISDLDAALSEARGLKSDLSDQAAELASLEDQLRSTRAQLEHAATEVAELRATHRDMAPRSELVAAEGRAEARDAAMAELSASVHALDTERGRLATQLQVSPHAPSDWLITADLAPVP